MFSFIKKLDKCDKRKGGKASKYWIRITHDQTEHYIGTAYSILAIKHSTVLWPIWVLGPVLHS